MSLPENLDKEKLAEVALAILFITLHNDRGVPRVWKGMDWDLLDLLFQNGWISDPVGKAKSVVLSEEAVELAGKFLKKHFAATADGGG